MYRARTNTLMDNSEAMIKYYQMYVDKVTEKDEEMAKPAVKAKLIESYNTMAGYVNFDVKQKQKYFAKR
jgi:hypothetical protein